jgi:hypothetical protein
MKPKPSTASRRLISRRQAVKAIRAAAWSATNPVVCNHSFFDRLLE